MISLMDTFRKWDTRGTGVISKTELAGLLAKLSPDFNQDTAEQLVQEVMPKNDGMIDYKDFFDKLIPDQPVTVDKDGKVVVSNSAFIKSPASPSIMDNMLLFLPKVAVLELNLEPNMDDKNARTKELWYGRVWELRALMDLQLNAVLKKIVKQQQELTEERRQELDARFADPAFLAKLSKVAARWRGAVLRKRNSLDFLERLKFCNMRGTLVYCHGSGGCSWDNFRICRMTAGMGVMVIAPDGFAYPRNTAMGQLRHKDLMPLKKATDDTDYWAGDLMYSSGSEGSATYSTKADGVLADSEGYRDLYEKCYQLRRSELHFTAKNLPSFVKTKGFFLGGTSEGGMTVARFDDHRYGERVIGRFINSYSVEYCYFTPTPEAGELGGQIDVPTLNIIGTKDQFFGPEDSVAKIVASDDTAGYGDKNLTGNAYNTFVRQNLECALVCVLEDGVHSPCNTHDNFLRELLDTFYSRPGSIWDLDNIWDNDPGLAELIEVRQTTEHDDTKANVVQVFVPRMKYPQHMSRREVDTLRKLKNWQGQIADQLEAEAQAIAQEQKEAQDMLDKVRSKCQCNGGGGFKTDQVDIHAKKGNFHGTNFYHHDTVKHVSHKRRRH